MDRIVCSVSGGRTSARMAELIKQNWSDREVLYIFANTGQEHEETLRFVRQVDEWLGLNLVWVESVVHPEDMVGTTHRVVDFESAHRGGDLFIDMCAKYGIPNPAYLHCTRELKLAPITSYLRSVGWNAGSYKTAIGYRIDEMKRVTAHPDRIYPLVTEWPHDKQDVNTRWENAPFDLELEEYQGNCKVCYKKHLPKLIRIAKEDRAAFDLPMMLEREYGSVKAPDKPRVMFRDHLSAIDVLNLADIWPDQFQLFDDPDKAGGCSESCEFVEAM